LRQAILAGVGRVEFHVLHPGPEQPLDVLFRHFAPDADAGCIRDAASFLERIERRNRIVWIESIAPAMWAARDGFLREYQHCCGEIPLLQRTQFCAMPPPQSAADALTGEVRLGVHRYDGFVAPLDALIYASLTYRSTSDSKERDVAVATIAAVALWDPAVAERADKS
jgi:hypothetical protein